MDGEESFAEFRRRVVHRLLAARLSLFGPEFIASPDSIAGPAGSRITLIDDDHSDSPRHLSFAFAFDGDSPVVVDCVEAPGDSDPDAVVNAVELWADTTGAALVEALVRDGTIARHQHDGAAAGFPGWHAILGGIKGWGLDDPDALPLWILDGHPLLPVVAPLIGDDLRDEYNGIKFFFGGAVGRETAEVRVNNVVHGPASTAIGALDWPRSRDVVRTFMLLLHRQNGAHD